MELETVAKRAVTPSWPDEMVQNQCETASPLLLEKNGNWEISSLEFIKMACDDLTSGNPLSLIALNFHVSLINSITELIRKLSHQTGIDRIVLSGGCMQNRLLLEGLIHTLSRKKLQVYTGNVLPVNDGAISFGQAVAGGLQHLA